jgi:hypothetical protein
MRPAEERISSADDEVPVLASRLLVRAAEMVPVLRSRERAAIEAGQVPAETIRAMAATSCRPGSIATSLAPWRRAA